MNLLIERLASDRTSEVGVFGRLSVDGKPFGVTCEQPWRDNAKGRSCVPAGDYELRPWDSDKYGAVVVLVNPDLMVYANEHDVPKQERGVARSACLIHAANWPHQLQGCVAVGNKIINIPPNGLGITDSRSMLAKLRTLWGDRRWLTLSIRWAP